MLRYILRVIKIINNKFVSFIYKYFFATSVIGKYL